jgi:glycosyltransferase involved in cell wall biosynthesis
MRKFCHRSSEFEHPRVQQTKVSVVVPVYNEAGTLREVLRRIEASPLDKEIIVVDDGSEKETRTLLEGIVRPGIRLLTHRFNRGKGAAVRTALGVTSGDVIVIQDADLEYDPADYERLVEPIVKYGADVVFGSRFLGRRHITNFWHRAANWLLTFVTNVLYGAHLTDMETCYKVLRTPIVKSLSLISDRFEIEAEITAKVLRRGYAIHEVPVSYIARSYHEGKKITYRDGIKTLWTLLKYRFVRV